MFASSVISESLKVILNVVNKIPEAMSLNEAFISGFRIFSVSIGDVLEIIGLKLSLSKSVSALVIIPTEIFAFVVSDKNSPFTESTAT